MDSGRFDPDAPARRRDESRPFVMIDGFNLSLERGTGVATYGRNLSYGLKELGYEVGVLYGSSFSNRYPALLQEVLFYDRDPRPTSLATRARGALRAALNPFGNRAFEVTLNGAVIANPFDSKLPCYDSVWNAPDVYSRSHALFHALGVVSRVLPSRRPDLVHWTYPLPLLVPGVPNIYTLHDLVPLRLPYTTLDKKARYLKLLRWICRTAAHIVTVSENSKRDIVEILGADPNKVTNTYEAARIPDKLRSKPEDHVRREVEGTFGLHHKGYFLFFGSIEPKKNIGRMIEGYLASGVKAPLVLVGARAWKAEQELGLLEADEMRARLGSQAGRVVKLEYVPFGLLVSLIRGAKAVVFPSLYEGFGLPILEAMLLGTPVLTSNTSSMPEVAGDAALLVDPYESRAIAEGIEALDTNATLRAELAARGLRRASLFRDTVYRERLATVYERVASACRRTTAKPSVEAAIGP